MYLRVFKVFLCLLWIQTKDAFAEISRKFVHQRDMSQHCKRRVVPSVFLGQHVADANSQVIQFSQLEVPYSCSLSVRAEAGSNIILIVELLSEDSLIDACSLSGDQLIVYELGETFGGYWGPIPDVVMKDSGKNYTQYYTLKTTRRSRKRPRRPSSTTQKKFLKDTETYSTVSEQEYYTMNVPIVNISGNFQLGPRRETNDSEDLFNYIYDVTPRNGVEYETSIMPLVQFSVRPQSKGYEGAERRYELDYDTQGFTMDPRLIFNTVKKKKTSFRKDWKANRRFRPRTKSPAFRSRDSKKLFIDNRAVTSIPTLVSNYFTNSWQLIDGIIKSIKASTLRSTVLKNETFLNILDIISNSQHNSSVYLAPNISVYNVDTLTKNNETILQDDSNQSLDNFTNLVEISELGLPTTSLLHTSEENSSQLTIELSTLEAEYDLRSTNEKTEENTTEKEINSLEESKTDEINMTYKFNTQNELIREFTAVPSTTTDKSIRNSFLTGAMVGHESWENIVQAAPVMAVALNNTEPLINNTITDVYKKRKNKRHIQALAIEQSRPRNLTTKSAIVSEVSSFDDIEDVARLLELQDDELDRLMLVLTPAQTLPSVVSQCPDGQLECQIVGTRVCIDSMNACDGVPNCGSYEIYDEERLACGTAHGVEHSVYLAALTFLAVILTAAYIILYWLERCVPRVSDAFFVYSDSSENELLLDSIMRSPNDDEDTSYKINYLGHFFEDDALCQDLNVEETNVNLCKKIFYACWKLLDFRKVSTEKSSEKNISEIQLQTREASKMFSFTQLELKKFGKIESKEKEVQTGDSFEIRDLKFHKDHAEKNSLNSLFMFKAMSHQNDTKRQDSELNLLKFSKESRSQNDSMSYENLKSAVIRHTVGTGTDREIEIDNTVYDDEPILGNASPVMREVHTVNKKMAQSSKRLRFDEELQMIPNIEEDEDNWPSSSSAVRQLNTNDDEDTIVQVQETEGSGRDFSRFWGAKGKKIKRKKLKYLS